MGFELEEREARRVLDAIELGSTSIADCFALLEQSDPTFVYLLFSWLRNRFANDPAAVGVIGRIVEICQRYPGVTRMMKQGEADSLAKWFEDTYEYRDLSADAFVRIVVEKLES